MKEIVLDGEIYVRKKDVSIFLRNEPRYKEHYSKSLLYKDNNAIKDVILVFIKENETNISIVSGVAKLFYDDFKIYLEEKNINLKIFLKTASTLGFILRNTQKKYKHQTSVNGKKASILKINLNVF